MRIGFIGAGKMRAPWCATWYRRGTKSSCATPAAQKRWPRRLPTSGPAAAGTRDDAINTDLVILAVRWVDAKKAVAGIDGMVGFLSMQPMAHAESSCRP